MVDVAAAAAEYRMKMDARRVWLCSLLASVSAGLLVSLCASAPASAASKPGTVAVLPILAYSAPRGATVRWGGVVLASERVTGRLLLEVQGHPLDTAGRPRAGAPSPGRFLVSAPLPAAGPPPHRRGELITVTGILGTEVRTTASGARVTLPVLVSRRREVWPAAPRPVSPRPAAVAPAPVYRAPSLLPWVVPFAIAGALVADHGHLSLGYGHSLRRHGRWHHRGFGRHRGFGHHRGFGPHRGYRHHGRGHRGHWRGHGRSGVRLSLGFRL
jgi:outer membrane lipoprotein